MKAVIDGRLYDTAAEGVVEIAVHSSLYRYDTLYRTKTGNYFVACLKCNPHIRALVVQEARDFISGLDADEINLEAAPELVTGVA